MASMRALQLAKSPTSTAPSLTLQDVPIPSLTPGHLLIRVSASAIHPSDLLNAKGAFPYTTFPRVPGRDFSGTVIEGPAARIGEEVYGTSGNTQAFTVDGAQAEFILVPEHAVALKPKNLNWAQAATIGVPFTTANTILSKASAKEGETVLVLGANGAVGSAVVQLAKARGCKVLQATRNDFSDVNTATDPTLSAIDGLTASKGVNVIVDAVGQPALTGAAIAKLARDGRLVFIAAPRSGSTELAVDMLSFYRLGKTLIGVNTLLFSAEEMAFQLADLTPLFESGALGLAEAGWNEVPLEGAVEAYEKGGKGKFVITMG